MISGSRYAQIWRSRIQQMFAIITNKSYKNLIVIRDVFLNGFNNITRHRTASAVIYLIYLSVFLKKKKIVVFVY